MQICVAEMEPATTIASLCRVSSDALSFHLLPSIVGKKKKKKDQLEGKSLRTALSLKHCKTSFYEETSKNWQPGCQTSDKVRAEWCRHVHGGVQLCV